MHVKITCLVTNVLYKDHTVHVKITCLVTNVLYKDHTVHVKITCLVLYKDHIKIKKQETYTVEQGEAFTVHVKMTCLVTNEYTKTISRSRNKKLKQ